jgi:hypothetical protein
MDSSKYSDPAIHRAMYTIFNPLVLTADSELHQLPQSLVISMTTRDFLPTTLIYETIFPIVEDTLNRMSMLPPETIKDAYNWKAPQPNTASEFIKFVRNLEHHAQRATPAYGTFAASNWNLNMLNEMKEAGYAKMLALFEPLKVIVPSSYLDTELSQEIYNIAQWTVPFVLQTMFDAQAYTLKENDTQFKVIEKGFTILVKGLMDLKAINSTETL